MKPDHDSAPKGSLQTNWVVGAKQAQGKTKPPGRVRSCPRPRRPVWGRRCPAKWHAEAKCCWFAPWPPTSLVTTNALSARVILAMSYALSTAMLFVVWLGVAVVLIPWVGYYMLQGGPGEES